jgi:imidazolonepropionase-like amidohydrolase
MLKPTRLLLRNATILDLELGTLVPDRSVLVTGDKITEVAGPSLKAPDADIIDLRGRTLMPGLIDCHVHVNAASADLRASERGGMRVTCRHAFAFVLVARCMRGGDRPGPVGGWILHPKS